MKRKVTILKACKLILAAIIIVYLFPVIVSAQEFLPPGLANISGPVSIAADDIVYWRLENRYVAKGNVVIETARFKLTCDEVEVNNTTGDFEARGNVKLTSNEITFACESFKFNNNNQQGTIVKGTLYVAETHTSIKADKIEKIGPGTYVIENVFYTTCQCESGKKPDWSIAARHLKAGETGYARTKGATIRIKDTPIFYVPAVLFPVKQERSTGFLMPEMGYSSRNGFEFSMPFYVAAARWWDFTVTERMMSERGVKQELELRWVRRLERTGELHAFYLDDWKTDENRWAGYYIGRVPLFAGFEWRQDLRWISDNEYVREFRNDDLTESRARFLESRMIVERPFDWGDLSLLFRATDDLQGDNIGTSYGYHDSDRIQPNQAPRLGFDTTLIPIPHTPLWVGTMSAFDNFYRESPTRTAPYGDENWTQRASVYPFVTTTFIPYPGVYVAPEAGFEETAWMAGDNEYGRCLAVGKLETGMRLYRIYKERFKHTIEPRVRYAIAHDLGSDLPLPMDMTDYLTDSQLIEFNLDQHFLVRQADKSGFVHGYDLAQLEITQDYNPDDGTFRTLRGQLTVRASNNLRVDSDTKYNIHNETLNYVVNALTYEDNRGDEITTSYRYQDEEKWQFLNDQLQFRLTPAVALTYFHYINLTERKFVDHGGGVILNPPSQCWSLKAEVSYRTDPNEVQFGMMVNLTGLGSAGSK